MIKTTTNEASKNPDPLYSIFERHLHNFQDPNADRKIFIEGIVKEYITLLRSMGLLIPTEWEPQVVEELTLQVSTMLLKKIYGFFDLKDYTEKRTEKRMTRTSAR